MKLRRHRPWREPKRERSSVWDGIWDVIVSGMEAGESPAPTTTTTTTPTMAGAQLFTVSVTTTILSTTFVTVPYSSAVSMSLESNSTSILLTSTTTNLDTILPPIVTPNSSVRLPSIATATPFGSSASNDTSDSMIGSDPESQTQKKAVVGGLSGTIAGLVFIGVVICLILRFRRRPRSEREGEFFGAQDEKALESPPPIFRTWTGLSFDRDRPRTEGRSSVTVDEDHRIIRMNTRHWPRPFAPGAGEGYRDSAPHGQLRVMNPDLSRPMTPRRSSETPSSFLKKQRSALTGLVFGSGGRNRQSQDLPTAAVDPTVSREHIAPYAARTRSPSFKSYPSIHTASVVRGQTPEDPFTTPDAQQQDRLRPRRPSIATLQSTASRTWTHLLHPFRARANTNPPSIHSVRGASHFSYSTNDSNPSRRSDPFDLDRPSVRGDHGSPRMGSEFQRRSAGGGWILYEGT